MAPKVVLPTDGPRSDTQIVKINWPQKHFAMFYHQDCIHRMAPESFFCGKTGSISPFYPVKK